METGWAGVRTAKLLYEVNNKVEPYVAAKARKYQSRWTGTSQAGNLDGRPVRYSNTKRDGEQWAYLGGAAEALDMRVYQPVGNRRISSGSCERLKIWTRFA